MLKRIIMIMVPTSIRTPEKSEERLEEMTFETFSASLVMRLMISPWEWLSRYGIGSETTLLKSSFRRRKITRWERRAEKKPCSSVADPWIRYASNINPRILGISPKAPVTRLSIALLWRLGAITLAETASTTAAAKRITYFFSGLK